MALPKALPMRRKVSALPLSLLEFFEADVLELDPHRFARMKLEGKDTFSQSQLRFVVREIQDQPSIKIVLNVISIGEDDNLIPVVVSVVLPSLLWTLVCGDTLLLRMLEIAVVTKSGAPASRLRVLCRNAILWSIVLLTLALFVWFP